jgi:chromosome segregation ATPase
MSTAGKVLVVLVLLVAPVWIVMVSTVAQLNKNAGAQLAGLEKNVATLESDVASMTKNIVSLKDQIALEQQAMNQQLVATRAHQADLQKARSEWIEIASREAYQVAAMQEAAKRAEATRDLRAAEKVQETAAKQAAEAEVEKLQQEHAQLTEQLDKLRGDFKATVDENRKLMARLKAKKAS